MFNIYRYGPAGSKCALSTLTEQLYYEAMLRNRPMQRDISSASADIAMSREPLRETDAGKHRTSQFTRKKIFRDLLIYLWPSSLMCFMEVCNVYTLSGESRP